MSAARSKPPVGAVLLTPGAGAGREHPTLLAVAEALDPLPVERIDFPYRREGRKAPDRAPKLIACIREEAAALADRAGVAPDRIVLGGRSMGGRMCSMAVAEGLPAAGLVLLSYPLHPPGKPEKLRVDHFGDLSAPCLFLSGDRDPFGKPDEFEKHTSTIPGAVTLSLLDGAGHDPKGCDDVTATTVAAWIGELAPE